MKIKLLIILLVILFSCETQKKEGFSNEESKAKIEVNLAQVKVKVLKPDKFTKQIISNGKVEAIDKSELHFKTNNQINSIKVKNGQSVTKGQILATLDNTLLKNQLDKAFIDFDKAKNKLDEEKINYSIDNASNNKVLKNLKIKSGYFEAENALENAQILYNQTILKAPISGVIANIEVKNGDYISTGDIFCTIISQKKLEVIFSVLENQISFITLNQKLKITPFANQEQNYSGNITEINPVVDENGLIQVKAKIKNPDDNLFDGINAKIVINKPIDNTILIPKEALVLRSNREVVFTLEKGLAKWNYVKVLDENSTSYAISEGLKIGDTTIVSGNMNLAHDAKVNATLAPQPD